MRQLYQSQKAYYLHKCIAGVQLLFLISVSGCAISYVNDEGHKRIIGLVNITLEQGEKSKSVDAFELTNLGVFVNSSPLSTSLSIGYAKETIIEIPNDALILLDDFKKGEKNESTDN
tara:strand:- start:1963 stop:2313 length:351 start_codon:yes stop_codon:yes gene_type:complete